MKLAMTTSAVTPCDGRNLGSGEAMPVPVDRDTKALGRRHEIYPIWSILPHAIESNTIVGFEELDGVPVITAAWCSAG